MTALAQKHKAAAQATPLYVPKQTFAEIISCSVRSCDRLIAAKLIPYVKLPTAPGRDGKLHGRVLIPVADALTALNKFRVNAIGESLPITTTPLPPARKRRAGRIAD